jgi:hypothetical protein
MITVAKIFIGILAGFFMMAARRYPSYYRTRTGYVVEAILFCVVGILIIFELWK